MINTQKSCIVPTQQMEFLGFLFDSVAYTITVTDEKHGSLLKLITSVVNNPTATMTIRHLAKIIGKIVLSLSVRYAIIGEVILTNILGESEKLLWQCNIAIELTAPRELKNFFVSIVQMDLTVRRHQIE